MKFIVACKKCKKVKRFGRFIQLDEERDKEFSEMVNNNRVQVVWVFCLECEKKK